LNGPGSHIPQDGEIKASSLTLNLLSDFLKGLGKLYTESNGVLWGISEWLCYCHSTAVISAVLARLHRLLVIMKHGRQDLKKKRG
jgi:hypothetical protein